MDPTAALQEIRELAAHDDPAEFADTLVERINDLDEWLTKGGFPPQQWNINGRPRKEGDGDVVLDGVNHGKASTYAKGCHCAECREANRMKAAKWRARHRMES